MLLSMIIHNTYLATEQQAFAHVSHPDHEAGPTFVIGYNRVLAKLHCLASLLGTSDLQEKSRSEN